MQQYQDLKFSPFSNPSLLCDRNRAESKAALPNINATDDDRVGRNMSCSDEFYNELNFKSCYCWTVDGKQLKTKIKQEPVELFRSWDYVCDGQTEGRT
jgi:hypothetical protein